MSQPKRILRDTVLGESQTRPPIWIMRQAGRYLPEYRALRETAGSFLDLCYTPKFSTEVTLQPLRRFDLDAAIIFSDILVIPDALGQKVAFEKGKGPILEPIDQDSLGLLKPENVLTHLQPVFEALSNVRAALSPEKTLIGFCGAPWTVLTYMIGGRGSPDQAAARLFALEHPKAFQHLLDILVEVSIEYLVAQFKAGADIVQVFESWALNLDELAFENYVLKPNQRIVAGVRAQIENAPIIGFPRGAAGLIGRYAEQSGVNMVGLDYAMPLEFAAQTVPSNIGVQGNLDPLRLVVGGAQMLDRADQIISKFQNRAHIFNLGHGIVPQTPIAHVEALVNHVKGR